jgi:hypothetical protein
MLRRSFTGSRPAMSSPSMVMVPADGVDHAVHHAQDRRLAAAGGTEEHGGLVGWELGAEVVDRDGAVGVGLGHAGQLDHG